MNEGHLIDMFAQFRKYLRHHLSAFASWSKSKWRLHQIADGVFEEAGGVGEFRSELFDGFVVPAFEFWFVVPSIDMAGATVDEDPDHAFGLCGKVRVLWSQRVQRSTAEIFSSGRRQQSLILQQPGQSQHAEPAAGCGKKTSSVQQEVVVHGSCFLGILLSVDLISRTALAGVSPWNRSLTIQPVLKGRHQPALSTIPVVPSGLEKTEPHNHGLASVATTYRPVGTKSHCQLVPRLHGLLTYRVNQNR